MLIAQISDTHVLTEGRRLADRFETGAAYARLIDSLEHLTTAPDLILFSGDLGEDATPEEYADIGAGLRRLTCPVLVVPGNHDARAPMIAALPDYVQTTPSGHICAFDNSRDLAIIGLDTLVEGKPHGELCADRLSWLSERLDDCADKPVLLFMHHPPMVTGLKDMDSMGLLSGGEELARLIADHGQVQAILCGHMHRAIHGSCGGAPVRVSPSASHQVAFDLRDGQPYRFTDEPPQYMMHLWSPERGLVSHVVPVAVA
tara:strand:- start:27425 stop:28201 length:777 start_codon:yes stop_codon:yes gene_type:complete